MMNNYAQTIGREAALKWWRSICLTHRGVLAHRHYSSLPYGAVTNSDSKIENIYMQEDMPPIREFNIVESDKVYLPVRIYSSMGFEYGRYTNTDTAEVVCDALNKVYEMEKDK